MIAPDVPFPMPTADVVAAAAVTAVVALNPVVDLIAYSAEQRKFLEQDAGIAAGRAVEYSPIEFVRPGNPPMLIQHGTHDEVVLSSKRDGSGTRWCRLAMTAYCLSTWAPDTPSTPRCLLR
jgi:hypothetical protein